MIPREAAEAAIAALGAVNPEALRLAEAVSLAVQVDKRLLRTARLALTRAGPEAEADLHFSRLVRDAAPSGLVFHPEAAFLLRRRLQADPDRLAQAWQVVSARHPQLPATLRTEEQLQWHALRGDTETVRDLLRACIGTMVEPGRPGFAAWAIDAVARMDPAARGLDEYRMLGLGAALRTGASQRQVADLADDRLAEWLAWLAPPAADQVKVGLALVEGEEGIGVEFGPASDPRYRHRIELPRRFPQVLELRDAATNRVQAVTLREQAVVFVPTEAAEIVITAEDGSRRRLRRETKPRFIREDRLPRVHLEYEVDTFGARQKVSLPFVLGVMADLSGHNRQGRPPLDARHFVEFTAETFDARMAAMAPRVRLQVADLLGGGHALDLRLTFRTMADFQPDALVKAVPQTAALLRLRQQVNDLLLYVDGNTALQAALEDLLDDPRRMLAMAGPDLSIPGIVASPAWATIRRKLASGGFVEAMAHFGELDRKIALKGLETKPDDDRRTRLRSRLQAILLLAGWGQKGKVIELIGSLGAELERQPERWEELQGYLTRQLALMASEVGTEEAERLIREANEAAIQSKGLDHPDSLWTATLLAEHYLDRRKHGHANEYLELAFHRNQGWTERDTRLALRMAIGLIELRARTNRTEEALATAREAIKRAEILYGRDCLLAKELRSFLLKPIKSWDVVPESRRWRHLLSKSAGREKSATTNNQTELRAFRTRLKQAMRSATPERLDRISRATAVACSLLIDFPDLLSTDLFTTLEAARRLIDRHLGEQVGLILRNPDFRRLERTWRGLHYLAANLPTGGDVKLKVLDIGRDELPLALAGPDPSPLHRLVHKAEFSQLGGQPYGAVICDFAFSHEPADLDVLAGLARQGERSMAPFIAAAAPALLGKPNWAELDYRYRAEDNLADPAHRGWQALRNQPESRFLVLTAPGMVARSAYGHDSDPTEAFAFEEGNAPPLTMNAGWGLGVVLADAFRTHGWFARIHGVETGGTLAGLPTATFGVERERRATEIAISDRLEAELAHAGLMPLVARRGTADATFISAPTVHRPATYQDAAATASSALAARLPHVLTWSRFAHYVMGICRDRIEMGTDETVRELAQHIQAWLDGYVAGDVPVDDARAQARPLKAARFEATFDNVTDKFRFRLITIPRFQFPGPDISLSGDIIPPLKDEP